MRSSIGTQIDKDIGKSLFLLLLQMVLGMRKDFSVRYAGSYIHIRLVRFKAATNEKKLTRNKEFPADVMS